MQFLIIEDDNETADFIATSLTERGHAHVLCNNGDDGLNKACAQNFDAMIVDRMLPNLDGLTLIKQLRQKGNTTPVLFLTAMTDVNDRVEGLDAGADDYLAKPFALTELMARLSAIVRRYHHTSEENRLVVDDLILDRLVRKVTRNGRDICLRTREFELLEFLMLQTGQLVTRNMLLEKVWHYHFDPQTNLIDVHISRLRAKLQLDNEKPLLHTLRGQGYSLHA